MSYLLSISSIVISIVIGLISQTLSLPIISYYFIYTGCLLLVICGIIKAINTSKQERSNYNNQEFTRTLLERYELSSVRGHTKEYIDELGNNPLLKEYLKQGRKYEEENKYNKAIKEYQNCLSHPKVTTKEKIVVNNYIGNCYYYLSNFHSSEKYYEISLNLTDNLTNNKVKLDLKAVVLRNIGAINNFSGNLQKAFDFNQKALKISKQIGSEIDIALNLNDIAITLIQFGKLDRALNNLDEAKTIFLKLNDTKNIGNCLLNIANIYMIRSEYKDALKYYQDSLDCFKKIESDEGVAKNLNNIGLIYSNRNIFDRSLKYHQEALEINQKLDNKEGIASSFTNISNVYFNQNKLDLALEYTQKSLQISQEIGSKKGIAFNFNNLGLIYRESKKLKKALYYHKKALKIDKKNRHKKGIISGLNNIAIVLSIQEKQHKAIKYLEKSLKIADRCNYEVGKATAFSNLGKIYLQNGKIDISMNNLEKALEIFKKIGNEKKINELEETIKKFRN